MRSILVFACFVTACSGSTEAPAASAADGEAPDDSALVQEASADDTATIADSAVADTSSPVTDSALDTPSLPGAERTFTFVNSCAYPVWVGALANPEFTVPAKGGFALAAG